MEFWLGGINKITVHIVQIIVLLADNHSQNVFEGFDTHLAKYIKGTHRLYFHYEYKMS